jgi:hypothetical protein
MSMLDGLRNVGPLAITDARFVRVRHSVSRYVVLYVVLVRLSRMPAECGKVTLCELRHIEGLLLALNLSPYPH